jgi:Holliday junction resolvase RusA-like endonuclease
VVTIRLECEPVAQPRHRFDPRSGRTYLPSDHPVHRFKEALRLQASLLKPSDAPWTGPVSVVAVFVLPRPQRPKRGPRRWHTARPDTDNLLTSCWDAVKGVLWVDDSQVSEVRASKVVAGPGELPHLILVVERIEGVPEGE